MIKEDGEEETAVVIDPTMLEDAVHNTNGQFDIKKVKIYEDHQYTAGFQT